MQWHNRWGGAECPPEISGREIFADVSGKKRQGKEKGKRVKIEKKRRKREGEIGNGKVIKEVRTFCFSFFFSFLKTTEICFEFVLGLPKWEIPGKSISWRGKKSRKMTLPRQKNACYAPADNIFINLLK